LEIAVKKNKKPNNKRKKTMRKSEKSVTHMTWKELRNYWLMMDGMITRTATGLSVFNRQESLSSIMTDGRVVALHAAVVSLTEQSKRLRAIKLAIPNYTGCVKSAHIFTYHDLHSQITEVFDTINANAVVVLGDLMAAFQDLDSAEETAVEPVATIAPAE